jgi:hypothetical protein
MQIEVEMRIRPAKQRQRRAHPHFDHRKLVALN